MTTKWILGLCAALLGGALIANDADAGRLGGARSSGVQRSVTPPSRPAQQQQAAPQQGQNTAAPAASGASRWMPMLGGLAIGGMLGYMFGGNGGFMGILLLVALGIVAVMAFRAFARRGTREAPQRMQYANMGPAQGQETVVAAPPSAQAAPQASPGASLPAGFDSASFLKAAKLNFIRLQAANDGSRLDEIREFMTDELFEELKNGIGGHQQTDVASLQADLLEVATEGNRHWASVHFSGTIRETPGAAPGGFEEVWNLVKPADGSSGWLLAGIQQMH
jgi:predicted lipid-binding transport protein (Tim44 family)